MERRNLYSFFVFCLLTSFLQAQYTNLKFENFDTSEGLSSSTATEIFQDSDGFLWFGTIDGLNQYNGYEFKIYRPELNNPNSISNNRINSIVEDDKGFLWIGTSSGLNVFDKRTEKFHRIHFKENSRSLTHTSETINDLLFEPSMNILWIGMKNGLIKLALDSIDRESFKNFKFERYKNVAADLHTIDNNNVTSVVKDKSHSIWISTEGGHLNHYQAETNNFKRYPIEVNKSFELNQLPKQVLVDNNNNFWIGNNLSNLVFWDRSNDTYEQISLVNKDIPIFDLFQDNQGIIWIATDGYGIFLFQKERGIFQHLQHNPQNPFSLPNNQPSKIFEDADDIIWIATYNKGVSKQAPAKSTFGHYFYQYGSKNGLSTKIAQFVLEDSEKRIWIGTDGGGLNLFNEDEGSFRHFRSDPDDGNSISSDKILYLTESFDGSIWIATWDGGLSRFDPEVEKAENYQHDPNDEYSLAENTVWCAVEDSLHRLWIGTRTKGLNLFNPVTEKFHTYKNDPENPESLISDFVFSLFIDSNQRLFIGTSLGLCVVDLKKLDKEIPGSIDFREVRHKNISGNRINYITEDKKGNIWVGTDIGLYKLDLNLQLLRSYSFQDGLPNNLIVGIAEDNNGNLWITTKSGLSLLNPHTETFKNFNVHDGLQGLEFQSKSIDETEDGRIIIGGINGFNIFDPEKIVTDADSLETFITNLKLLNDNVRVGDTVNGRVLLNKPLSEIDQITLKHNETYFAFEFVSLYYPNPERVKYRYRMKGLDDNYIKAGISRTANYSNLPPGNYIFEVEASVDDQWENAKSSVVNIKVLPPIWLTWWAYSIYFLLIIGIILGVFWFFTRKVREEKERELDQMKLRFFMNVSHEFRTPLTLILNPVDKIISYYNDPDEVKKSALVIQRSARRLLYLINQLLDFRKMDIGKASLELYKIDLVKFSRDTFAMFEDLASSKNLDLKFSSSENELWLNLDPDKLEKIITNLISNAIKFTPHGGSIRVGLTLGNVPNQKETQVFKSKRPQEFVEIKVEDTGIGFKEDQLKEVFSRFFHIDNTKTGTGIGLNFTKSLVELHGGSITVESDYGVGSVFTVCLPVDLEAPSEEQNLFNSKVYKKVPDFIKATEYEIAISGEDMEEDFPEIDEGKEKPTLLIVEDNKELRSHLKNELKGNFVIKEAKDGSVGYDKVKKYFPDIVISDVMMPEMDGFELCRLIKTDLETCHIPVVLLTARSMEEDRIEGYETGADEYLPKPFNIQVLRARIRNLLEAKKRIREKFTSISGVAVSSNVTTNSLDEAFLDKATKIIIENISDAEFTLEDVINGVGIGRSQFYRKINSITGENPSHFIRTIRLKYASELLLHSDHSIKEVSYMSGFNSSAYFSKTFKELFGVTPTQFVKNKEAERESKVS